MSQAAAGSASSDARSHARFVFWACFIALVATSFGFGVRGVIIEQLGVEFGLDQTQQGEILGAGLWPFALTIVLFSLVVDKIGYGRSMAFAFLCHVVSGLIIILADGYWDLYVGMLIFALGNGTVEAVINPAVATLFPREKTKWLSILHAGWPAGIIIGGLLAMAMAESGLVAQMAGGAVDWQWKWGLIFVPVGIYGLMMLRCRFPVHERVTAGVSYREMLQQVGILGCLIVVSLLVFELTRIFEATAGLFAGWDDSAKLSAKIGIIVALSLPFALYVRHLGRPMFIFLLLVMIPLATTELGIDSWITALMEPQMAQLGLQAGWVLVYTSMIMMVLRFFSGPIVHRISPLGLLAVSSIIAAVGLVALSKTTGVTILVAATIYGIGKSFFWPTTLGLVAERFPKGGALTINTVAGVGLLGVGVIGNAFLGNIQDRRVNDLLAEEHPSLHRQFIGQKQESVFGEYRSLRRDEMARLNDQINLYERRQHVADQLEQKLGHKPSRQELVQALKQDGRYRVLIKTAYNRLPAEDRPDDADSYSAMLAAVRDNGLLVDAETYQTINQRAEKLQAATGSAKKNALATIALLPIIMLLCYMVLILYFRTQGGYRAETLLSEQEEEELMTGGAEGPVE